MASTTLVPLAPGSDIAKELTTSMYTVLVTAAKNAAASAKDDDTGAGGGAGGGAGAGASGSAAALTKEAVTSFYDACRKAVQRSDYLTFVNEVLKHVETLFDHPDEKEVEGVFSVLLTVVQGAISDGDDTTQLVQNMCTVVAANTTRAALRLRVLANIFNLTPSTSPSRFSIFLQLVTYTSTTSQLDLLLPYIKEADKWVKEWNLSQDQARQLFRALFDALDAAGKSDLAQAYLVKLLQSYNGEDAATLAAQAPLARQAVLGFVRDVVKAASTTFLADVDAVRALSSDADGAVLLQLLDICTTKTVAAYQAFATANAARFAAWGLDNEACLANMRLLSLCSLAAEAGNTPVPFRIVANTLQINEEDVEKWVVRAVSADLVAARMDQMTREVFISRYTPRVFGDADWAALQVQLHSWTNNVAALLETITRSRAKQQPAGGTRVFRR